MIYLGVTHVSNSIFFALSMFVLHHKLITKLSILCNIFCFIFKIVHIVNINDNHNQDAMGMQYNYENKYLHAHTHVHNYFSRCSMLNA